MQVSASLTTYRTMSRLAAVITLAIALLGTQATAEESCDNVNNALLQVGASRERFSGQGGPGPRPKCSFTSFVPPITPMHRRTISATSKNVLFWSSGVFVVQDRGSRILVFQRSDNDECHEQADVSCSGSGQSEKQVHHMDALQQDEGVLSQQEGEACGKAPACDIGAAYPSLSYDRSMIGGALVTVGGTKQIKHLVNIGIGAGIISNWCQKHLPGAKLDNVDINAEVIAAAPCFGIKRSDRNKLIEADGRQYIEQQADGSLDVVFVDAFDDHDHVSACLATVEFFQILRRKLSKHGAVTMNVWAHQISSLYSSMEKAFGSDRVSIGTAPGLGNFILMASNLGTAGKKKKVDRAFVETELEFSGGSRLSDDTEADDADGGGMISAMGVDSHLARARLAEAEAKKWYKEAAFTKHTLESVHEYYDHDAKGKPTGQVSDIQACPAAVAKKRKKK